MRSRALRLACCVSTPQMVRVAVKQDLQRFPVAGFPQSTQVWGLINRLHGWHVGVGWLPIPRHSGVPHDEQGTLALGIHPYRGQSFRNRVARALFPRAAPSDRLHLRCPGPRIPMPDASWQRSHAEPGAMILVGMRQMGSLHVASPRATTGAHARRMAR
jgi:hypothetical protein